MSWTRFAAILSAAVLAGSTTLASAADQEYGRSGPYLGAGGEYIVQNFGGSGLRDPGNAGGYNLRGGYRFNRYFALEMDWEQFLGFNDSTGDTDIWLVSLNGKLYPFDGRFQPYLSAGGGWSSVDDHRIPSEESGFAARFGAGLDVYVTRNWAFTTDIGYVLPTGSISDHDSVPFQFGVLYRFY